MEFMNRGTQPSAARVAQSGPAPVGGGSSKNRGWRGSPKWLRVLSVTLLFAITILAVSLLCLMYFGNSRESDYIDNDKQQAVFLTNGQVYFGKINNVTRQYIELRDIYYLSVNQQVQPKDDSDNKSNNVTLVKLGCELHGPADQMLINREQVTFWENLKDNGQVADAIAQWTKDNPNGLQCSSSQPATTTGTGAAAKP